MNVQVQLFARARDLAGSGCVSLELPDPARVGDLRAALAARIPQLDRLVSSLLVAVGNEYASDDFPLAAGAEVACFPPVSGG
ncbi:MAG: MoaD/ThiS family protein [Planctomycetales bacterium]